MLPGICVSSKASVEMSENECCSLMLEHLFRDEENLCSGVSRHLCPLVSDEAVHISLQNYASNPESKGKQEKLSSNCTQESFVISKTERKGVAH